MSFRFGTDAAGWLDLPWLAPIDGAHSETISVDSVSLGGVTTQNIRAYKRRWQAVNKIVDAATYAQLVVMREKVGGPFWLYDSTRPNLMAGRAARMMRGWVDSAGAVLTPSASLRLAIPASKITTPAGLLPGVAKLTPWQPGASACVAATAKAGSASTLQIGCRWYRADGTFISAGYVSVAVLTFEARQAATVMAPPATAYVQPYLYTTASTVTVTDVTLLPGNLDLGGAWYAAQILDLTEQHYNDRQHLISLQLREP